MTEASQEKPPFAWQPLTPLGVATFAHATLGRLLLVQGLVALLVAGTVVWFLATDWFPSVGKAIERLPAQGEIRAGQLQWLGDSPAPLSEGHFLAFAVDLNHKGEARSPAHVQVEFGRTDLKVFSLFGYLEMNYPRGWVVAFNRAELKPWWGAWAPALLALAALSVSLWLMLTWTILATLYCWLPWLIGYFADRDLNLRASWRLAGAALMPGAFFLTGAMLLYGLGGLDLVQLTAAVAVHFLLGWVYLVVSPFWVPRHPALRGQQTNPFSRPGSGSSALTAKPEQKEPDSATPR